METARKQLAVIVAYFLIYVVWGSTYYFIGVALEGFPPFLLGALRFTAAGLLLLVLCRFHRERIFRKELIRRSAVSGIVLLFIDMAVIMLAQRYVSSSLVAIVASSTAVWIMLLDVPMWKQNFRNVAAAGGIVLGFIGVGLLYFEQLDMKTDMPHSEYGILLLIGGCLSWALGTLYTKYRSCGSESANGFAGSAWQMFSASVMFWICRRNTGNRFRRSPAQSMACPGLPDYFRLHTGLFRIRLATESTSGNRSRHPCLCQSGRSGSYRNGVGQ